MASLIVSQINSRIIIDTYAWNRFQPNNSVSVSTFGRQTQPSNGCFDFDDIDCDSDDSEYYDGGRNVPSKLQDTSNDGKNQSGNPLTKDQLLLCSTILKGYSLKEKKWRKYTSAPITDRQC